MVIEPRYIALVITFMLPTLSRASPADPYAKIYDILIETTRDDCRGAGIWRSKSVIDTMRINPHQRADLMAEAAGRCINEGYQIAELIYSELHTGQMSMEDARFCGSRVDSPSPEFAGDTILMRFLSCMQRRNQK